MVRPKADVLAYTCEKCAFTHEMCPGIVAYVLIPHGEGVVLVRDLGSRSSDWTLPGVRLRHLEYPNTAAIRAALEDAGVKVRITKKLKEEMNTQNNDLAHIFMGELTEDCPVDASKPTRPTVFHRLAIPSLAWYPLDTIVGHWQERKPCQLAGRRYAVIHVGSEAFGTRWLSASREDGGVSYSVVARQKAVDAPLQLLASKCLAPDTPYVHVAVKDAMTTEEIADLIRCYLLDPDIPRDVKVTEDEWPELANSEVVEE